MSNNKRVAVIGFGHIGSVIAAVLADQGCNVTGIDKNKNLIDDFLIGNAPISERHSMKILMQT